MASSGLYHAHPPIPERLRHLGYVLPFVYVFAFDDMADGRFHSVTGSGEAVQPFEPAEIDVQPFGGYAVEPAEEPTDPGMESVDPVQTLMGVSLEHPVYGRFEVGQYRSVSSEHVRIDYRPFGHLALHRSGEIVASRPSSAWDVVEHVACVVHAGDDADLVVAGTGRTVAGTPLLRFPGFPFEFLERLSLETLRDVHLVDLHLGIPFDLERRDLVECRFAQAGAHEPCGLVTHAQSFRDPVAAQTVDEAFCISHPGLPGEFSIEQYPAGIVWDSGPAA